MRLAKDIMTWLVFVTGIILMGVHAPSLRLIQEWDKFIMFALLLIVVEMRTIVLESDKVSFSAGFAVIFASMLTLGTPASVFLIVLAAITHGLVSKKPVDRVCFNLGMLAVSTHVTGMVLNLWKVPVGDFPLESHWWALIPAVLIYLVINTGMISLYLAVERGKNPITIWRNAFSSAGIDYVGLGFLGTCAAITINAEGNIGLLASAGLILFLQRTFSHHVRVGREIAVRTYWEKQAFTDSLTKLANQRRLGKWLEQSLPADSPVSVIMIDIDNFKKYNDGFGHLMGDQILCDVAEVLALNTRREDLVIRYGGDEFIIVLNGQSKEVAAQVAERIRAGVSSLSTPEFPITVSVGIASYPDDGTESQELLKKADRALYLAKEGGKNLVQVYSN